MIFKAVLVSVLTYLCVFIAGESPIHFIQILYASSFGGWEQFASLLFYLTPLLFTGLSVLLCLEAGFFNLGAEGQLSLGALGSLVGAAFVAPKLGITGKFGGITTGLFFCFVFSGAWGLAVGWLRAYRKNHEVIVSILMNFIAQALMSWAVLYPFKNPETQHPESVWILESFRIPTLWNQITWGFPLALLLFFIIFFLIKKTWLGFQLRAMGQNVRAAETMGINSKRLTCLCFALSGMCAGLVGFNEFFLYSHRLVDGFSSGFGYTGLALALLSKGKPVQFLLSALLFGVLHKSSLDFELETQNLTRDLGLVIQAFVLLVLAIQSDSSFLKKWMTKK